MTDKIMLPLLLFVISLVLVFYNGGDKSMQSPVVKIIKKTSGLLLIAADIGLIVCNSIGR